MSLSNFKQYFAGAGLAIGIIILTFQLGDIIILLINPEVNSIFNTIIFMLIIASHVVGGYISGYLVTKKIIGDHLIIGLTTAVLTYVIEKFYFALLGNQTISDIWILGCLIISCIAGAFRSKSTIKNNISSDK